MKIPSLTPVACGLLLASAVLGTTPASAQTEEDIIVTGRWGRVPDNVDSLSQRVSYRDLDLSQRDDWRELRRRISLTARYLCDRLGEPDSAASSLAPSCRDAAARGCAAPHRHGPPAVRAARHRLGCAGALGTALSGGLGNHLSGRRLPGLSVTRRGAVPAPLPFNRADRNR